VFVYVFVCLGVFGCVRVCVCVCVCVCVSLSLSLSLSHHATFLSTHLSLESWYLYNKYLYICIYLYIHIFVDASLYAFTYIFMNTVSFIGLFCKRAL